MIRVLAAAGLLLAAPPAAAQGLPCLPWENLLTVLMGRFGEQAQWMGIAGPAGAPRPVMLFAHPDGGTWSIVVRRPDGTGCLAMSGSVWEAVAPVPAGEPG
ncbi:MAG: hypothetical protein ACK4KW_14200 [Gemmobacter sp.]